MRHGNRPSFRRRVARVLEAALIAVDPSAAVRAHISLVGQTLCLGSATYALDEIDRIFVIGAGKAGAPMAAALFDILGSRITAGIVNVKHGHAAAAGGRRVRFEKRPNPDAVVRTESGVATSPGMRSAESSVLKSRSHAVTGPITLFEAGHPVPDAAGQAGAERIAALLGELTSRDLVIVLLSGGGSALLPLPAAGISLADYAALTDVLLRCGADITEINAVRKHCSRLQGGQLGRLAAPAQVAALILSDVVGSPLDAIASGPTVPDPSTFSDAAAVLRRYSVLGEAPLSIRRHLEDGVVGAIPDTPKPGDRLFERVTNVIIGDNTSAGHAAVEEAARLGFRSALLTTFIQGEAREVGKVMAGLAQGIACGQSEYSAPACLVLGGETTVTMRGSGLGGRNQELALAAGIALDRYPLPAGTEVAVVGLGTDGTDGPTDAAGGIGMGDTVARGRASGLDARAALAANDSYHYLGALGDLVITGPTNTNVNDLIFVFVTQAPGQEAESDDTFARAQAL